MGTCNCILYEQFDLINIFSCKWHELNLVDVMDLCSPTLFCVVMCRSEAQSFSDAVTSGCGSKYWVWLFVRIISIA
jgi:hypothetical protein